MPSATYLPSSDRRRAPLSRRAIALLLAIVAHILIVLVLLHLSPSPPEVKVDEREPKSFALLPDPKPEPTPAPLSPKVAKVKSASGAAPKSPKPPKPPSSKDPKPAKSPPPAMIQLVGGSEMFDATDISKLPTHPGDEVASGGGPGGVGQGKDSGSVYGPGEGPGGERLYNAEWYREPTHAELNGYMPPNAQSGWAEIACRTIPDYHVENCRSLGESPVGSGLARALRQAAWQFRVRPPRIGGRQMIGAWVRIHFDLQEGIRK